ncbi:hypothetical protein [Promicromonospora iranensis]|uniref:Uncharacterized protein n=1 Tax=Promicromonospora iranensis TaxID=1105144 RepID=A0ABU2CIG3_9MICO|nr:hypothetical protein [Promicromonospora iranensis]MDR7381112.1 hypothetical protein [Promicromonospora iranensis]
MTDVPEIYVSQLTHYIAAKTAPEADRAIAGIRDQLAHDYEHWKDHWKPVKDALFRDRRGSRDGQELADIVDRAAVNRQASYAVAAARWAQLAGWWEGLESERLGTRAVQVGGLSVKVPRLCAERHPGGELEVLYVRFNQDRLPLHVVYGVMRIVQLAHPTADITFVDVHQRATHSSRGRDLSVYDAWITQAGTDLAQLLISGQSQATAA